MQVSTQLHNLPLRQKVEKNNQQINQTATKTSVNLKNEASITGNYSDNKPNNVHKEYQSRINTNAIRQYQQLNHNSDDELLKKAFCVDITV